MIQELNLLEKLKWTSCWQIRKFRNDKFYRLGRPYAVSKFEGNLMLNEGINALWTLVAGGSETAYTNTNARLGVGNDITAANAAQTGLIGGSTAFKAMDAGYPTYGTSQKITFRSTYGSAEGNFAWEEFTVDNGATPNKNLNRKVESKGTKVSGETWELTLEITLS